jgi:hypothetical protein
LHEFELIEPEKVTVPPVSAFAACPATIAAVPTASLKRG